MTDTATGRKDQLTIGSVRLVASPLTGEDAPLPVDALPVTITPSQPAPREAVEETCETCEWWHEVNADRTRGRCGWLGHSLTDEAYIARYHGESLLEGDYQALQYLWTGPSWKCPGYQRRADGGE